MAQLRPHAASRCRAEPLYNSRPICNVNSRPSAATAASRRDMLSLLGAASTSQLVPDSQQTSGIPPQRASSSSPTVTSSSGRLELEQRVAEFTLPNGLHFIVLPRTTAPIVSCHVHASVGAFVEEEGSTGIAHLLEHMAFKGTPAVGSKDWGREAPLLLAADEAFYELRGALQEGSPADSGRVQRLQQRFKQVQAAADDLVVPNAFGALLQSAGGVGLNAATSQDSTRYFLSLPSNKLELWFALESQRFQVPVFRSLYSEKEVVAEERRMRQENSPMGALMYSYQQQVFGNNYRRPVIGYAQDVDAMGTQEVARFFERYYHPRNLTISVVGDVTPEQVQQLAEKYFGAWSPAATMEVLPLQQPEPLLYAKPDVQASIGGAGAADNTTTTTSSSSSSTSLRLREVERRSPAGPLCLLAFYRPSLLGKTGVALEVASDVLTAGRSSRMVQQLVMQGKCLGASVSPSYPSELHAGVALVSGVPVNGNSPKQLARLLQDQLAALMEGGPSAQELGRVKKDSRTSLYSSLTSNSSMAQLLAGYHATTGSWKGLLQELQMVEDLTADDVRDAAQLVFPAGNSFAAYVTRGQAA